MHHVEATARWKKTLWTTVCDVLAVQHGYHRTTTELDGISDTATRLRTRRALGRWSNETWSCSTGDVLPDLQLLRRIQQEERGRCDLRWLALQPAFSHGTLIGPSGEQERAVTYSAISSAKSAVGDIVRWFQERRSLGSGAPRWNSH